MPLKLKRVSSPPLSVSGNSVLFNGTNQSLTVPSNATFDFGTGDFTIEGWIYSISSKDYGILVGRWGGYAVNGNSSYAIRQETAASRKYQFGFTTNGSTDILITALNTFSLNTWYHLAAVRNGTTFTFYVNGVSQGTITNANAVFAGTTNLTVGGANNNTDLMNGYASNIRVIKGTALYTSNFTPPTAPLTAIANTQLLTCNAPTIIDSSSNNFTITNNGTATVSSAVTPFTAPSYASTFKFKNVNNAARVLAGTQRAIFGYGTIVTGANVSMTNLVSNTGVVANDTTGVGTARVRLAAAGYGLDKAIFGYGFTSANVSMTNLVSNTGVVATDTTGVGTARYGLAAAGYGSDKAIFGYGEGGYVTNLVSNTGVVSNNITGVGTSRRYLAAAGYGTDKAIFGYGFAGVDRRSMTNLVSNTGVVASDTTGVGTARDGLAAAGYGGDKAIFGYGNPGGALLSITNLVSNTGVVATNTTGVGTIREHTAAAGYGSDKALFGYGVGSNYLSITNLVSNTGVVATNTTGVGTARFQLAAAGFSVAFAPAPSGGSFKKVFADPIIVYLTQKAIFGYGNTDGAVSVTNLVSNTGVVANDTTGVGSTRGYLAAAGYGSDKAIFGYGNTGSHVSMTNKVSNTGVVSTDTAGVGTVRYALAAAGYSLT